MYTVYAIISDTDGRISVGFTKSVLRRLEEHNSGQVFSTRPFRPWKLFYTEKVDTRQNARLREKYLKSGTGKEYLKAIIRE